MKSIYLKKHTQTERHSFSFRHVVVPHMYDKYHYHEELELNCIYKGSGTRYIGTSINNFTDHDLVLVGSALSHVWVNNPEYYQQESSPKAEVINILFLKDFLGESFTMLPEMQHIGRMFERASLGLVFYGQTKHTALEMIYRLSALNASDRLVGFISVLNLLAQSNECREMLPAQLPTPNNNYDIHKVNTVYDYLIQNFTKKIYIAELAEIANMNSSAFCRYFKKVNKKTVIEFITELRINYACKLLQTQNYNITQVAYECGFNNPSMFYRKFKASTGINPKAYQNNYT